MGKKLNINQVIELFDSHDYELQEFDYESAKTLLPFICKRHPDDGIQYTSYAQLKYKNKGCKSCKIERFNQRCRFPVEQIKLLVEEQGFDFVYVEYDSSKKNNTTKIYYKCPIHEKIYSTSLFTVKQRKIKCWDCQYEENKNKFLNRLHAIHPLIELAGNFISQSQKTKFKCLKHDLIFDYKPSKLLEGLSGCPECRKEKKTLLNHEQRLSTEEFTERLHQEYPELKVVGNYVDRNTPVELYCKKHDHSFFRKPKEYLDKHTKSCCPIDNAYRKTTEDFKQELFDRFGSRVVLIGKYLGFFEKTMFYCEQHKMSWETTPAIIMRGKGCPKCTMSTGELAIYQLLEKNGIKFEYQKRFEDCKKTKPLPFDFYLPDFNMCIEFDGEQHFSKDSIWWTQDKDNRFSEISDNDLIKNKYCQTNNIRLLRIPYYEKDNIDSILKDTLQQHANTEVN